MAHAPGERSIPQKIPELLPDEMALYERKKTSSLDSLKRAFHVDEESGKKEIRERVRIWKA